jgi:hypothetical protein
MNTNYFYFLLRALREFRGNRNFYSPSPEYPAAFCGELHLAIYAAKFKRPFEKSNGLSFSLNLTIS